MAKVAKKAWPWPGLPGFTRPHFPGKLGQKPGKSGLARLCQAGRVFDRAPDARACFYFKMNEAKPVYQTVLEEDSFPIDSCKTESKLFTINRLNLRQNVCNTVQ